MLVRCFSTTYTHAVWTRCLSNLHVHSYDVSVPPILKLCKCDFFSSLHVPYVIHAVGPNYNSLDSLEEGDSLLESAYATSMVLAAKAGLATVGFSLLSAGIFRGRRSLSVRIASLPLEHISVC